MISGRQTLASIDRALQGARQQLQAVDTEAQKTSTELARERQREADQYAQLARHRIEQLDDERLLSALDGADRRARELLTERDAALTVLTDATNVAQEQQTQLEVTRQALNKVTDTEEEALEACLAAAEETIRSAPEYQDKLAAAQHAAELASRAGEKTAQAQQDREIKGRPYEQDALFMYLWERGYGTPRYRAWLASRLMDGVVARHIRFEPARRNFHLLNEIPRRLQAHTERLEAAADAAIAEIDNVEREAAIAAGAVPLEEKLAASRKELEELDRRIAEEEDRFADLMRQREAFAVGKDPYFSEAIEVLVASFRAESIQRLQQEAESTTGYADDALVDGLSEIRRKKLVLEELLEDNHRLHERHLERIQGLENVRRRFKESRYDSAGSLFDDPGTLQMMLAEYLRGMVNVDGLWRAIRYAQRFRRVVTSSGMRSSRGWGGGFRMPRSSGGRGFGGGGFRTGGRF